MALKRCLDCFRWALPGKSRCAGHYLIKERMRGTTTQRGYGHAHQQRRAQDLATYHPSDPCPRCGQPLGPDPTLLDEGHTDDRAGYEGLTHADCNRGTARRR
jgi:hypothetical protein